MVSPLSAQMALLTPPRLHGVA